MLSAKKDFDSVSRSTLKPQTTNSMGSHDIIHKLQPFVIPRVSAIANMGWCEHALTIFRSLVLRLIILKAQERSVAQCIELS